MENKIAQIIMLTKYVKERGFNVYISNFGSSLLEISHHDRESSKLIVTISAYTESSLDCISDYLKGLIA